MARYERLVYTVPSRYGLTQGEVEDVYQSVWFGVRPFGVHLNGFVRARGELV